MLEQKQTSNFTVLVVIKSISAKLLHLITSILYTTAYSVIIFKSPLPQVALLYCANRPHSDFCDLHSPSAHLSDYMGPGLGVCMHILNRPPSFCVCVLKGGDNQEFRRKVQDAMCSEMSLSTSVTVGVCSVCSCLRQTTCSAPQGPPVILHPLSPTDLTDGLHCVCTFVCLCRRGYV